MPTAATNKRVLTGRRNRLRRSLTAIETLTPKGKETTPYFGRVSIPLKERVFVSSGEPGVSAEQEAHIIAEYLRSNYNSPTEEGATSNGAMLYVDISASVNEGNSTDALDAEIRNLKVVYVPGDANEQNEKIMAEWDEKNYPNAQVAFYQGRWFIVGPTASVANPPVLV